MERENLATDVYEYLIKKLRVMWALFLATVILLAATNCVWANTYFRYKAHQEEYVPSQDMDDAIIPEASTDGKRKRGK